MWRTKNLTAGVGPQLGFIRPLKIQESVLVPKAYSFLSIPTFSLFPIVFFLFPLVEPQVMAYYGSDPYKALLWLSDLSLFSIPPPWAVIPMCLMYISGCCNFLFSLTLSLLSHSFNKIHVEHLFCVWHCGLGDIPVPEKSCPHVVTWCFQLSSVEMPLLMASNIKSKYIMK